MGCHFLLQCMKVKSEREVAQSCLTLSAPVRTFQKRGNTVLHGWVHGPRQGHGVGSVWLCPPPPVMGRPSLWPPLCCLRAPSVLSTRSHLLPAVICFALFLLCLFKGCSCRRGCHGMASTLRSPSCVWFKEPRSKKADSTLCLGLAMKWWQSRGLHQTRSPLSGGGRKGLEQFWGSWQVTTCRSNSFAHRPRAVFDFNSYLLNTCFEPNTGLGACMPQWLWLALNASPSSIQTVNAVEGGECWVMSVLETVKNTINSPVPTPGEWKGRRVQHGRWGRRLCRLTAVNWNPGSCPCQPCDLGRAAYPLWSSASSSVKQRP